MLKNYTIETIQGQNPQLVQSKKLSITSNSSRFQSQKEKQSDLSSFTSQSPDGLIIKEDKKVIRDNKWVVCWTQEEDKLLFQKYIEEGSKWVIISNCFPSKSMNAVKNRFYSCIKKVYRKINKTQKQMKNKPNKSITYRSLLTILQIGKCQLGISNKRFQDIRRNMDKILNLRNLIIEIARCPEQNIGVSLTKALINDFLELKYSLKFVNIQRVRFEAKQLIQQKTSQNSMIKVAVKSSINKKKSCQQLQNNLVQQKNLYLENESGKESNFTLEEYMQLGQLQTRNNDSLFQQCQDVLKMQPLEQTFDYQFFL